MAAEKGNCLARKLKTSELRSEAYKQYCDHLARGDSKETWYFDHPELTLVHESMEKYIRDFPDELATIKKDIALRKGQAIWESIVQDSAKGINPKANVASLQMWMRNRFGWDRNTYRPDGHNEASIRAHEKLLEQIGQTQEHLESASNASSPAPSASTHE